MRLGLPSFNFKSRNTIILFLLLLLVGGGLTGYRVYDYISNNPAFCKTCHIMDKAFASWKKSIHVNINCHSCHQLSIRDGMRLGYSLVVNRPKIIPPRHGRVIVPGKFCVRCHFEVHKDYPKAASIKVSQFHAKHGFEEKIECSKCHGYVAHQFLPEERFCIICHKEKEVHGVGMEGLACLNCHSDRTKDLRPEREKCLFCHGSDEVRDTILKEKRLDVKYFQPSADTIKKATKIEEPLDTRHQFYCYACHKPHEKARPDWSECMACHGDILDTGRHKFHVKDMNIECQTCHKLHSWVVTQAQAEKECVKCHKSAEIYKKWTG